MTDGGGLGFHRFLFPHHSVKILDPPGSGQVPTARWHQLWGALSKKGSLGEAELGESSVLQVTQR